MVVLPRKNEAFVFEREKTPLLKGMCNNHRRREAKCHHSTALFLQFSSSLCTLMCGCI